MSQSISTQKTVNQEVNVVSYYFGGGRCFPKRVELEGRSLDFVESGLRCLVQKGQDLIQIFNMTDGQKQYRLSFEPNRRTWTLLSMRAL